MPEGSIDFLNDKPGLVWDAMGKHASQMVSSPLRRCNSMPFHSFPRFWCVLMTLSHRCGSGGYTWLSQVTPSSIASRNSELSEATRSDPVLPLCQFVRWYFVSLPYAINVQYSESASEVTASFLCWSVGLKHRLHSRSSLGFALRWDRSACILLSPQWHLVILSSLRNEFVRGGVQGSARARPQARRHFGNDHWSASASLYPRLLFLFLILSRFFLYI